MCFLGVTSCDSLDLVSPSSIADSGYWLTEDQFEAFHTGVATYVRARQGNIFIFGELRAGHLGDTPFGGEATQGYENLWNNTLSYSTPVVTNYGGLYYAINQVNLLIAKTEETTLLDDDTRNYYLGEGYGLRAWLYFQLLRTYGDVIVVTDYSSGTSIDIGNMTRTQDDETVVLAQIKEDIASSESAFGSDYSYTKGKYFWSLSATKMLKGEVYLWSGAQMSGGSSDYTTAKTALQEVVSNSGCSLLSDYSSIFSFSNKKNSEIIYAMYNGEDETTLYGGYYSYFMPQLNMLCNGTRFNEDGEDFNDTSDNEFNSVMRFPLCTELYDKLYVDTDARKRANLRAVYYSANQTAEDAEYEACFAYKFQGTVISGATSRSYYDDNIIYRYADALLLLATAKYYLGEDISSEINEVRQRAYGDNYSSAVAYGNDNDSELYSDNEWVKADSAGDLEVILKERLRELIFEGKRWYDLRLTGMCTEYSTATSSKLLWPLDEDTMTDNSALVQTPGYTDY